MQLDKKNKTLVIEDKITIDLKSYALRWLGQQNVYFCFSLDSLNKNNKYKTIYIGSLNQEFSMNWYRQVCESLSIVYKDPATNPPGQPIPKSIDLDQGLDILEMTKNDKDL